MNEQQLLRVISSKKNIFIYGAGMVGGLVLSRLKKLGVDDSHIFFVVTQALPDQMYQGHKVFSIADCYLKDDSIFIVATLPNLHKSIIDQLKKYDVSDYVVVTKSLYNEMEMQFILESEKKVNSKIDILYMSSDNNFTSGAFLCMIDLCKEMMHRKIKPLVVLPGYGNGEKLLNENNIDYIYVQSRSGLISDNEDDFTVENKINIAAVSELKRIIINNNVYLIYNNTMHTYVGALAAQELSVPYIWHIRENIWEQGYNFFDQKKIYNLLNNANRIITVSKYVGDCYTELNKCKIRCIYDGVDIQKYFYDHLIFPSKSIKILMPGAMIPLKGQKQLICSAIELRKKGIDFSVSLVGSGDADYILELKDIVDKYEMKDVIHFYDSVGDLEEWYRRADIVTICSRSEAFGRVTVEAQLAGCLVIGAACGATIELIENGKTGFLYEYGDVKSLTETIVRAIENISESLSIAKKGQQQAKIKFSRSLNCENVISEYKKILDEKGIMYE